MFKVRRTREHHRSNTVLRCLAESPKAAIYPMLLPNLLGEQISQVKAEISAIWCACSTIWMVNLWRSARKRQELCYRIGQTLAGMDISLTKLTHPAKERYLPWDKTCH
ncbi:MAG: hypothetical protein R2865_07060 [Deinococcales bacterium]